MSTSNNNTTPLTTGNTIKRRSFLKATTAVAGGGLLLGFNWLGACNAPVEKVVMKALPKNWYDLNAFLKIGENGLVTIFSPNPEIGQNVKTSMPMIVAEELDAPWSDVLVEQAGLSVDFDRQVAGGSQSIRSSWKALRQAGATAKQMLINTAAKQWNIDPADCIATAGVVSNSKGEKLSYGELAAAASQMEVPKAEDVKLKDPKTFTLIGQSQPNVDMDKIITGQPQYGLDTKVEGMLYATALRPPAFGMKLKDFDDSAARKVNGVVDVLRFADNKVAILANSTWAAMKGQKALIANWEKDSAYESTTDHDRRLNELLNVKSKEARRDDGDTTKAFAEADTVHEKTYEAPFLPHNCLEPMNFFAHVQDDGKVKLKGPIQTPKWCQSRVAAILGMPNKTDEERTKNNELITLELTRMGGGFGRRLYGDFSDEAAEISSKAGNKPIQLIFSRENDMAAGTYRPASKYKLRAAIKDGEITGYHMTEACINANMYDNIPNFFPAGAIPNLRIDTNNFKSNITTGAWRAPYTNFLGFAEQSFFDELAELLKKDPVQLRLELFEKAKNKTDVGYEYDPVKAIAVTKLAAEKSEWGKLGANVFQGFSMYYSHNTHVAEVANVIMNNGQPVIQKITCAVHCGIVVNPLAAKNQIEGGIIDGIGHALYGDFTFKNGIPAAVNFDKYRMIRMNEAPEIDVHFVQSYDDPTGLGEPSLPPAGGAIANALFKATGTRFYKQPFSMGSRES